MKINIPLFFRFTCSCAHIQVSAKWRSLHGRMLLLFSRFSAELQSSCSPCVPSSHLFAIFFITMFFKPFFLAAQYESRAFLRTSHRSFEKQCARTMRERLNRKMQNSEKSLIWKIRAEYAVYMTWIQFEIL